MHLQGFGVIIGLALRTQAAVTVHYFNQASCNANTAQDVYTNAAPAAENTDCIGVAIAGISAIYVDGIDDECTVRTYAAASCNENLGLSITAGTCYFKESSTIGSWRAICGSSASSSTDSVVTISLTSTSSTVGSEIASAPDSSTTMIDSSTTTVDTDVGLVLTSVETVTPTTTQAEATPPTDGAPMATQMPTTGGIASDGGNGTNWNMTHSRLSPTGSPGLQGTSAGTGMGTSGARKVVDLNRWAKQILGCFVVVEVIRGWLF